MVQKQMIICTSPDVSAHLAPKIVAASPETELFTAQLNKDQHQLWDVMLDLKNQTVC